MIDSFYHGFKIENVGEAEREGHGMPCPYEVLNADRSPKNSEDRFARKKPSSQTSLANLARNDRI
jgi:hypothetical protein